MIVNIFNLKRQGTAILRILHHHSTIQWPVLTILYVLEYNYEEQNLRDNTVRRQNGVLSIVKRGASSHDDLKDSSLRWLIFHIILILKYLYPKKYRYSPLLVKFSIHNLNDKRKSFVNVGLLHFFIIIIQTI